MKSIGFHENQLRKDIFELQFYEMLLISLY